MSKMDFGAIRYSHRLLIEHGPLGTLIRINESLQAISGFFKRSDRWIRNFQNYLDGGLDRKYGINTTGIISVENLDVDQNSSKESIWYQPMSVKVFNQIINSLNIKNNEYEFVDYGSGKGRVLFLANIKGFKKSIGVEFSQNLCDDANKNIAAFKSKFQGPVNIEVICQDAQTYKIPEVPVVLFFFSPFKGKMLKTVIDNIYTSYQKNKREIIIVFYGHNSESIKILMESGFTPKELKVSADWLQFTKYRAFTLKSPN